jgi:alpha-tubulin suppressor-like RCC1 family protein
MNGVYKVSISESHAFIIKNGNLYAWGNNEDGRLGVNNDYKYESTPVLVSNSGNWTDISAGFNHSLGICGGNLYAWGNNYNGQLGLTYVNQFYSDNADLFIPRFSDLGHKDFGKSEAFFDQNSTLLSTLKTVKEI